MEHPGQGPSESRPQSTADMELGQMTSGVTPTVQCTSGVTPTVQCTSGVMPTVQCKGPVHDLLLQQQKRLGKETLLAFFKGFCNEIENEIENESD